MEYKTVKIFSGGEFQNYIKGLKLAECMKVLSEREPNEGNVTPTVKSEVESEYISSMQDLKLCDALFCSFCNTAFEDNIQQRMHYKLDWHRYNLKRNLLNLKPITEEDFIKLVDNVSSISASESDNEEIEFHSSESPKRQMKKIEKIYSMQDAECASSDETSNNNYNLNILRHSKIFFENEEGKILSFYKCILHSRKESPEGDDLVKMASEIDSKLSWAILITGGGHFAAGIFKGSEIVLHKTFHSYTVRGKQGGNQSTRDNRSGGSHPKSAGASLRRYNELSFAQHVQSILNQWKQELDGCDLIFCRAVGHNRQLLFGGRHPLLSKLDSRVRHIPFPTRRATFNEVKRIFDLLSSIEVYGQSSDFPNTVPETPRKKTIKLLAQKLDELEEPQDPILETGNTESLPRSRKKKKCKPVINRAKSRDLPSRPLPDITTQYVMSSTESSVHGTECSSLLQEEQQILLTDSILEFDVQLGFAMDKIRRNVGGKTLRMHRKHLKSSCLTGNVSLLKTTLDIISKIVLEMQDDSTVHQEHLLRCLNEPVDDEGNTLLHLAAMQGNIDILRILMECGSDPSHKNKKQQTPYISATCKEARIAFRRFCADFPEKYDYAKSQIPGPMTEEQEQEAIEKKRSIKKAKKLREKQRKQEKQILEAEQRDVQTFLSLPDEIKALAFMEPIPPGHLHVHPCLKTKRCFQCGFNVTSWVPFEYEGFRFCTINCLKEHRKKFKDTMQ